jgi:hypothetical protein
MSSDAVAAADQAIAALERGGAIGTDLLIVMVQARGESAEHLRRRNHLGLVPLTRRQRLLAIFELRALVAEWTGRGEGERS